VDPPPQPAGFGNCVRCPYLISGPAQVCFDCAKSSFERLAKNRCSLCERALESDGSCGNPLCSWEEDDRYFKRVWAVSMRTGPLRRAIDRYKVEGRQSWARIFGRVLLGYLNANKDTFERYDLIVPSPTYVGEGGRTFDHTGLVIERAAGEDDDETWPFELGIMQKSDATTPFRGKTWQRRREIAELELRPALTIPDPGEVRGKRILVYDDVYTEGLTLREVARSLRDAGAVEVSEIVLARQPYSGGQ
jgi:predicted amidophosphoribosyltransferase